MWYSSTSQRCDLPTCKKKRENSLYPKQNKNHCTTHHHFSSSYHRSLRSRVRERKFTVKTRLLGCNFPQLHEKKNFVDQWREAILAKEEASAAAAAASAFYDAPLVRPWLATMFGLLAKSTMYMDETPHS